MDFNSMGLGHAAKVMQSRPQVKTLTPEEKIALIKQKFNLHHGKGKRKKKIRKRGSDYK